MSERLKSLDVFRGLAIASMIVVNSVGSPQDSYSQLLHSPWDGWTFADTIFPAFLFIVGVSMTLSMATRIETEASRKSLVTHALRRALIIFASGVFIETLIFPSRQFPYFTFRDHLQLTGALQKIAVCYLMSFLIFLRGGWRGALTGVVGMNLLYLGLLYLYPVTGCGPGILTPECAFPNFVNNWILDGYTSGAIYDENGLGNDLPAITSVLLGVLAGDFLRITPDNRKRVQLLLGYGLGLVATGVILSSWVPFNKHLWTPSYALLMAGLAAIAFTATYLVVDTQQAGRYFKPFEILGLNAITCYLTSRLVDHALRAHVFTVSIPEIIQRLASPAMASLLFAIIILGVVYLGAWFIYRRQWFLKF